MHFLSAVVITFNEEKNIGRCIAALKHVADEILIIDSFSTDHTVEICEQAGGVRVLQKKWSGFGPQKKFGADAAMYENIIALDADEVLDQRAIESIQALKVEGFDAVYEIELHHFYFGKFLLHGQEYPNYKKRIFNKNYVNWNANLVHEGLEIPASYPVKKLPGRINHYSYHTIEQYLQKSNLYTSIAAGELYNKGKKSYFLKMLFSPSFTFIKSYFFKAGILDGFHGFVIAMLNGYTNFVKYAKLWELQRRDRI